MRTLMVIKKSENENRRGLGRRILSCHLALGDDVPSTACRILMSRHPKARRNHAWFVPGSAQIELTLGHHRRSSPYPLKLRRFPLAGSAAQDIRRLCTDLDQRH